MTALKIIEMNLGGVNCYLLDTGSGFVLIDSGFPGKRAALRNRLEDAGCRPGNLRLIILTHGDSDHAGNCAYLRREYNAETAMHLADLGMVERGDMTWNRQVGLSFSGILFRILSVFLGLRPSDRFRPDILIEDGQDLSAFGLDAKILHIPGHSMGSLAVLTGNGALFCGDLLMNGRKPGKHFAIPDDAGFRTSIGKLTRLSINMVYPGHGKCFPFSEFLKDYKG